MIHTYTYKSASTGKFMYFTSKVVYAHYIYIYIYMIYVYIHTHIYIYTHMCVHHCVSQSGDLILPICMLVFPCAYTYGYTNFASYRYTYFASCTNPPHLHLLCHHMHTHIPTHIHTHTYRNNPCGCHRVCHTIFQSLHPRLL